MSFNLSSGPVSDEDVTEFTDRIIIASFASLMAFGLVLAYAITITRFRLWQSSPILEKIPQAISNPLAHALSIGVGLVAVFPHGNDLYSIWIVVLALIFDNVQATSKYSLLERSADRMSHEFVFIYNCVIIGSVVIRSNRESDFYNPLVALWSLLVLKFLERQVNYKIGDKAYGIENTNLVADYMETEHTLSDDRLINPQTMKGYKYLVMGEEKVQCKIEHPLYNVEFEDSNKEVVTLERVWECNKRFLNQTVDKDNRIKDVCLSFALFKLIRRRFFGFPASESKVPKTKQFVFKGLLSRPGNDKEGVFRVIKTEIGFLRDFFYTQYPIAFALGFPVFSILMLIVMCAISISISSKASDYTESFKTEIPLSENIKNANHRITNGLLVIVIMTQIFEVCSYTFSDWMKATIISWHIRSKIEGTIPVIDQILGLLIKLTFTNSLRNTIGQYSLLKSYNKGGCKRIPNNFIYHMTCTMVLTRMPEGMQEDPEIFLPLEVKEAVYDTLKASDGDFTDRLAPLKLNEVPEEDVRWLDTLKDRPVLTIMVWHIATSLCEIRPLMNQPIVEQTDSWSTRFTERLPGCFKKRDTPDERVLKSHKLVASSLSKYCAYLVAFAPELLPTTTHSAKRTFEKIVSETSEFFDDADGPTAQYDKVIMHVPQFDEKGDKIIDMGIKLGRYLMEKIPDDARRWKVMADVWVDLILYVAPKGHTSGHLKKLANGSEFITHLWALLYHAGIVVSVSDECDSFT